MRASVRNSVGVGLHGFFANKTSPFAGTKRREFHPLALCLRLHAAYTYIYTHIFTYVFIYIHTPGMLRIVSVSALLGTLEGNRGSVFFLDCPRDRIDRRFSLNSLSGFLG